MIIPILLSNWAIRFILEQLWKTSSSYSRHNREKGWIIAYDISKTTFYDHGEFDWKGHRVKVSYNHECVFSETGLWVFWDAPYFIVSFIRFLVLINKFSMDFLELNIFKWSILWSMACRFLSTFPSVPPFEEAEQLQVMTQILAL